jgi:hypothetical protein
MTKDNDAAEAFFAKHAIAEEIWQARPYERWEIRDPGNIARRHFAAMNKDQKAHVNKVVNTAPGWVIVRHPPPEMGLDKIYPEQRPDWLVQSEQPRRHWHSSGEPPPDPKWYRVFTGDPDDPYSSLYAHIHQKDESEDETKPKHPDDERGAAGRNRKRNQHLGTNTQEIHTHFDFAKYVFPPSPKMDRAWRHDHDFTEDDKGQQVRRKWRPGPGQKGMTPEQCRAAHVANYPDDHAVDVAGPHTHSHGQVKDPTNPIACRLDVHLDAMQKIIDEPVVFFALEGCIKADSILSAGYAVFSVPSVSLWDCRELKAFSDRYLATGPDDRGGKIVVVVCDADWSTNSQVYTQAFLCRSKLHTFRVPDVCVAAPPLTFRGENTKGVDDFLFAGGRLPELIVVDSVPPANLEEVVKALELEHGIRRRDRIARDVDMVRALSAYTGDDGTYAGAVEMLAKIWGERDFKQVNPAVTGLEEIGAIEREGDARTRKSYFSGREEWVKTPTLTLIPKLRSEMRSERLWDALGEHSPDPPYQPHFKSDDAEFMFVQDALAVLNAFAPAGPRAVPSDLEARLRATHGRITRRSARGEDITDA